MAGASTFTQGPDQIEPEMPIQEIFPIMRFISNFTRPSAEYFNKLRSNCSTETLTITRALNNGHNGIVKINFHNS